MAIGISSEKKFGDLVDQVEKTKRQYDIIDNNLDDIREEVDQYLAWLKEKEDLLTRETPRGYSVKEAEAKLAKNNTKRTSGVYIKFSSGIYDEFIYNHWVDATAGGDLFP
ncbi:hypothetical protein AM593_00056, partial [Mytilus galloprovincialis]